MSYFRKKKMSTNFITEVEQQSIFDNLQRLKIENKIQRIDKINKIVDYLIEHDEKWKNALKKDLGKHPKEAQITELAPIISTASYIKKNIDAWHRNKTVGSPIFMLGLSSYIKYEPKGQVLVISPWNYPLQLAVTPILYAIAAGNAVVLKPSEIAKSTSSFLKEMFDLLFDKNDIYVVEGGIEETTTLLEHPFNHIFFTGSPAVGKIIMKAASKNLSSVTLELGGKSPLIIDGTQNAEKSAEISVFGKCTNAGQTCIAPDFVLIKDEHLKEYVSAFEFQIKNVYSSIESSDFYGKIINQKNFDRLIGLLNDAIEKGAEIISGGEYDREKLFIAPTILVNVNNDMKIMQEEIFGPLLPICTYNEIKEVPEMLSKMDKPLALYICSKNKKNIKYILDNTSAGGSAINEVMVTSINPELPFGGVNNSGIGKSNGKHSFIEFSNERGIVHRKWYNLKMVHPPYKNPMLKLLNWLAKY